MARSCLRHVAKVHRGPGQPAHRLVENTRLQALEIRRMLHGLDIEISLGELGPRGGDAFAVDIWVEQECCEAIGAASHSAHQVDELW